MFYPGIARWCGPTAELGLYTPLYGACGIPPFYERVLI